VLSTGCQWRAIPKDLPPKSTVYEAKLDRVAGSPRCRDSKADGALDAMLVPSIK
jgi:transposase